MERVTQKPDGTYRWSCRIDTEFHRRSAKKGVWGCVIIAAVILIIYALIPSSPRMQKEIWMAFIPIAVVMAIALPLLFLQYRASDPHEQYVMSEDYVKSGYGKSAVYSEFKKTKELTVAPKYIELVGRHGSNRVYVPLEDMDYVRDYIIKRMPEDVNIRYI